MLKVYPKYIRNKNMLNAYLGEYEGGKRGLYKLRLVIKMTINITHWHQSSPCRKK